MRLMLKIAPQEPVSMDDAWMARGSRRIFCFFVFNDSVDAILLTHKLQETLEGLAKHPYHRRQCVCVLPYTDCRRVLLVCLA